MTTKNNGVSEEARRAVRASTMSLRGICRLAGIDPGQLSNFVSGKKRLGLATLEQLAGALDMELVLRPKRERRKRKAR